MDLLVFLLLTFVLLPCICGTFDLDDDFEDDTWQEMNVVIVGVLVWCSLALQQMGHSRQRNPPVITQRLNWELHLRKIIDRGTFRRMYRMDEGDFAKLIQILGPRLVDYRWIGFKFMLVLEFKYFVIKMVIHLLVVCFLALLLLLLFPLAFSLSTLALFLTFNDTFSLDLSYRSD